jgi:hypothetical protein
MRRLDEVLLEKEIFSIDLVKIDVEGYEAKVFQGAPNLLAQYQPRLVKSEVWGNVVGSSGSAYLKRFKDAGYNFFEDSKCQVPMDALLEVTSKKFADVFFCNQYGVNGALLAIEAKQEEAARLDAEKAKQEEAARLAAEEAQREEAARLDAEKAQREEAARLDAEAATAAEVAKKEHAAAVERAKQHAAEVQRAGGWDHATDPASGKVYYFKRGSRETTWDPPPLWDQATDPASGQVYYFNRVTLETTWTRPW